MKKPLGRGLGALLGGAATAENIDSSTNAINNKSPEPSAATGSALMVDIRLVEPNPTQPRQFFDEDALLELAESMKTFGIVQPLLVTNTDGHYTIIAGERRYRAARLAKLPEVPVIIKDYTEMEIVQVALLENIQRQDLTSIEEANCYKRLMDDFFFSAEDIAVKLGKNKHTVISLLHLLELCPAVQELAALGKITASHAKVLLSVEDPELQTLCAEKIVAEGLSVRGAETMIQLALKTAAKKAAEEKATGETDEAEKQELENVALAYRRAESELKHVLGSQVHIRPGKKKSKIEIEYYTSEDLDRILKIFRDMEK